MVKKQLLSIALCILFSLNISATRKVEDFNFEWEFAKGDLQGAEQVLFDDADWQNVRLPHDWSVNEDFTQENSAGATAFLPGGIGWYRKAFKVPQSDEGKVISVEFDGVYTNSTVWINGHKLGSRPNGYAAFSYDLSPYINYGNDNVIVVKADRSAYVDSRWYPGSGIYRKVKLVTKNKVHIPQWGIKITTPEVSTEEALVILKTELVNADKRRAKYTLHTTIFDDNGQEVISETNDKVLNAGLKDLVIAKMRVRQPALWDCENPHLYTAVSVLSVKGKEVDRCETRFGIRSIHYDANEGFFLNGKNTLMRGVNLHHDGGLVGAAVPDGVWRRRLSLLKEAGCNAIRTAHNPPSAAFLDLCDEMGFLVQDEIFDEFNNPKSKRHNFNQEKAEEVTRGYTEHFDDWAERDLKVMINRDYNHPCIVMWSLGNEIEWTYPRYGASTGYWGSNKATPTTNYYWDEPPLSIEKMKENFYAMDSGEYCLATTVKQLSKWLKEVDTSRPVTANLVIPSVSSFSGYTDALDIIGYSYRQVVYDYGHKHYPEKMILGTENFPRWHEWKYVIERPFIPGMFIWTGIGYLGESSRWPSHGGGSGLLNLAGFKNPAFYQFKGFWTEEPVLYLTTQTFDKSPYKLQNDRVVEKVEGWWKRQKWGWQAVNEHWNYEYGDTVAVEAYTNCDKVELFLDGVSQGIVYLKDNEDRILKWAVPYSAGRLEAKGHLPNGEIINYVIVTSQAPAAIRLTVDKAELEANNYDVAHVVAEIVDANGVVVKHADLAQHIQFDIEGDARMLGVDNGADTNIEGFYKNTVMTYRGKCLMILQANDTAGEVKVNVSAEGLKGSELILKVK